MPRCREEREVYGGEALQDWQQEGEEEVEGGQGGDRPRLRVVRDPPPVVVLVTEPRAGDGEGEQGPPEGGCEVVPVHPVTDTIGQVVEGTDPGKAIPAILCNKFLLIQNKFNLTSDNH